MGEIEFTDGAYRIEDTGVDLSFYTGVVELATGELWLRLTIVSGALTAQIDMDPDRALQLALNFPELILKAMDEIHKQDEIRKEGVVSHDDRED